MAVLHRVRVASITLTMAYATIALGQGAKPITLTPEETRGAHSDATNFFGDSPADPGPIATDLSPDLNSAGVKKVIARVADWQLTRAETHFNQQWTFGALYCGFMAASATTGDLRYHDAMTALGEKFSWDITRPGSGRPGDLLNPPPPPGPNGAPPPPPRPLGNPQLARTYPVNANSEALAQTYEELYFQYKNPWMIDSTRKTLDDQIPIETYPTGRGGFGRGANAGGTNASTTQPAATASGNPPGNPAAGRGGGRGGDQGSAAATNPHHIIWWWCDALFMGPPAWARMYQATYDKKYLDYLDHQWWITSGYLYDTQDHLYYRDASFITKHESNGKKVYWSRGEGWVVGGLARVLQYMPADWPTREKYLTQFKEMCAAIAALQQPDGLWTAGMLDPDYYAQPENSGSSFFCYAMAWGINEGILDRATYEPVVEKAWAGLVGHIHQDGRLDCIQQTGSGPAHFKQSSSYVYGVGAFLLAGHEVNRLALNMASAKQN